MNDADGMVAQHEAVERLTYASLSGDPGSVEEAFAQLQSLAEVTPSTGTATSAARQVVVDNDPFTAAALGWLTTPQLRALVAENPGRYLSQAEQDAYIEQGNGFLSTVVRSRLDGVSPLELLARGPRQRQSDYELAARGRVKDARKLHQLLREQGLLDNDDQ